jgi:hypothetical protein
LASARVSSRHDCELVNLKGLAEIALKEQNYVEAKELWLEASAIAQELDDQEAAVELRNRATKLSM